MKVIKASHYLTPSHVSPRDARSADDGTATRFIIRVAGALVATLVAAACSGGVDWSDYEGVDLVSTRSRDASLWYFAPGLDTDTDATATVDYVEFEEVSSAVYGTLPAGVAGPVYRLEVVNLFQDGTFEESDVADGADHLTLGGGNAIGWREGDIDGGGDLANTTIVETDSIAGQSISLRFDNDSVYYAVNLSTALLDGFPTSSLYAFHLDFRSSSQEFGIELHDNTSSGSDQITQLISRNSPGDETTVYAYPGSAGENADIVDAADPSDNSITPESGFSYFSFGGFDVTARETIRATIDNIRFVRADQNHHARLPVPITEAGRPDLSSGGSYTVTVWVRNDPTAEGASAPNRTPARFMSAGIDPRIADSTSVTSSRGVSGTTRFYVGGLTDWQQFNATVNASAVAFSASIVDGDEIALDLVLEIGHSIAGSQFRDAGSVLVTGIAMEWSPNQN